MPDQETPLFLRFDGQLLVKLAKTCGFERTQTSLRQNQAFEWLKFVANGYSKSIGCGITMEWIMRSTKLFIIAAALTCALMATSASAVTITTINLFYTKAKTPLPGLPPVSDRFSANDKLMVQIVTSSATLNTTSLSDAAGNYRRFRDTSGTIRVFNNWPEPGSTPAPGDFVTLSDRGVDIRVYDDHVRFGTRGGGGTPAGEFFLQLNASRNTVTIPDGSSLGSTSSFDDLITFLAANPEANGGKMRVRTISGSSTLNALDSKTALDGVDVSQVVSTVPLPAGAWLLLGGVGIMALRRKRAA